MYAMFPSAAPNNSTSGEPDLNEKLLSYEDDSFVMIRDSMKEYDKLETLDSTRRDMKKSCYKRPHEVLYTFLTMRSFWNLINVPIFWCSIGIYVLIRVCQITNLYPNGSEGIYFATPMSTLGTFMSFAVTFYTSNCYHRFYAIYLSAMGAQGKVYEISLTAKATLPPEEYWRIWRYMNVAHIVAYTGLSGVYTKNNLFIPLISKYKLLTTEEYDRLLSVGIESGGSGYREVLTWVTESFYRLHRKGVLAIEDVNSLMGLIRAFRSSCGTMYDYVDQPIPMIYVVQSYVAYAFLLLYSYYAALSLSGLNSKNTSVSASENVFGGLTVLIVNIFVCGMIGEWIADVIVIVVRD